MSSMWGKYIKVSVFGESHGKAIGVTIDGLPPGERIDFDDVNTLLKRREPCDEYVCTERREENKFEILSGIKDDITTGAPLCAVIYNTDVNKNDYKDLKFTPRPGHADYTSYVRYKGFNDISGGGHLSGRITVPITFAGAIAYSILKKRGIKIVSHIKLLKNIYDDSFSKTVLNDEVIKELNSSNFPVINKKILNKMKEIIKETSKQFDSIGGIIESYAIGVPEGLGSPIFRGVENVLSSLLFSIPSVKGVEFGAGFNSATMYGSENNDEFYYDENGQINTKTNNCGGILGGITTGEPIIVKVAVKPTPSIGVTQNTIDINKKQNTAIKIKGRHDTCIVPRAVPIVESLIALGLIDLMIEVNLL